MFDSMNRLDRMENRLALVASYIQGKSKPWNMPTEVTLELTNRCNLNCAMCPRNTCSRPVGDMDLELFRRIVSQCSSTVEAANICLGGEPLLYPHLPQVFDSLQKNGLDSYLQTNALLLDDEKADVLIHSGLGAIVFSLDAVTQNTYQAIHGGGDLALAEKNIKVFLQKKKQYGKGPFVVVQLVLQKGNVHEAEAFRRKWAGSGADSVRIKPLNINFHNRRRFEELAVATTKPPGVRKTKCIRLWRGMTVLWDGSCVPCCYDFCGMEVVGDLKENSLARVWLGPELARMRELHASGKNDEIPLCASCNKVNMNLSQVAAAIGSLFLGYSDALRLLPFMEKLGLAG